MFPIFRFNLLKSGNWYSNLFFSTGKSIKNKDIYFGTATSDHDLGTKCNKIVDWLGKQYRVRIIVERKGSIASQRPKETIMNLIFQKCKGQFKEVGEQKVDELRLIANIQGIEEKKVEQ